MAESEKPLHWVSPTVIATIVATAFSLGSTWLMRSCDRIEAKKEKGDSYQEAKLGQIDLRLNQIEKEISHLDGQIKVFTQIIAAPRGRLSSVFVPLDSVQETTHVLKNAYGIQVLDQKRTTTSDIPETVKSMFPLSSNVDWAEIKIQKIE